MPIVVQIQMTFVMVFAFEISSGAMPNSGRLYVGDKIHLCLAFHPFVSWKCWNFTGTLRNLIPEPRTFETFQQPCHAGGFRHLQNNPESFPPHFSPLKRSRIKTSQIKGHFGKKPGASFLFHPFFLFRLPGAASPTLPNLPPPFASLLHPHLPLLEISRSKSTSTSQCSTSTGRRSLRFGTQGLPSFKTRENDLMGFAKPPGKSFIKNHIMVWSK